mgnify:CR=1 FL=1
MFFDMLIASLKINLKSLNASFFFQIINTICIIGIIYLIYKLIKWVKNRFTSNDNIKKRVEKVRKRCGKN